MTDSRRSKIEALLAEDPHDDFLRYSLALELAKEGQLEGCLQRLQLLMDQPVPYVPAFLMAAQRLVVAGRTEAARAALRRGIDAARQQGDFHAAGEMGQLLVSLGVQGAEPST
jgi:hypothetical protein